MEVPVVGHDENWGQDDDHEDQNIETKKHLVHTWAMTTFKSKKINQYNKMAARES